MAQPEDRSHAPGGARTDSAVAPSRGSGPRQMTQQKDARDGPVDNPQAEDEDIGLSLAQGGDRLDRGRDRDVEREHGPRTRQARKDEISRRPI